MTTSAHAQTGGAWQVFVRHNVTEAGEDVLVFIDTRSGEQTTVSVLGERYTIAGRFVMFYEPLTDHVRIVSADGRVRDHPFIQPAAGARRVDWVLSGDGRRVAWTQTFNTGVGDRTELTTITTVADITGENAREVLVDGPREGVRAQPVAFGENNETLYMDFQPDRIGDVTPYRQFAGLFALVDGEPQSLPGEPGCFCGAGIAAGQFVRLSLTNDLSAFDVEIHDLRLGTSERIRALALEGFTSASPVIIAPDGSYAAYALAQVEGFGTPDAVLRSQAVLVDLRDFSQTAVGRPVNALVYPVAWTEDDTGAIFTSVQPGVTWKLNVGDETFDRVAEATYLGLLQFGQ